MFFSLKKYVVIFITLFSSQGFSETTNFTDPTDTPTHIIPKLANTGFFPQITTDSSGRNVYAIWAEGNASIAPIQVAISHDFGVTWQDPTDTPTHTIPTLASGNSPQIITDGSGQFVYAIWTGFRSNHLIQVAISNDFGVTWIDPSSTPGPGGPPDLDSSGDTPQITTDSSGKYVYAIWIENPSKIQVAISNDFGVNWAYPSSTPTSSIPDLASSGVTPQITTDSSGKYVYAIWRKTTNPIQVAISQDFGITWIDPTDTPTHIIPNLAPIGSAPQITTDSSGKYVYAIWKGSPSPIQVAISQDFGITWADPASTPTGSIPDLASSGFQPQITTDSSGRYVYAIWTGITFAIQVAISQDFGITWADPASTPTGYIPNLASSGNLPKITTDSSGRYVYAIWQTFSNAIQVAISQGFGITWINPTSTPSDVIPNLTAIGHTPQITTDSSGQFVYTIWRGPSPNYPIEAAIGLKTFFPITKMTFKHSF